MIDEKILIDYLEKHSDNAWGKMGDIGSDSYVVNEESFYFGVYRALEDFQSFLEKQLLEEKK